MRTLIKFIIPILLFTTCGGNTHADTFNTINKISSDKAEKIDSIFSKYNQNTPGFAVAIVRNGEVVFMKTYGMAKPDKKISISPDTRFLIGSNSKQFTCMSILLLEEQGKLNIDDPIKDYLTELPDFAKQVTIKHLMNHTSGIMEFNPLLFHSGIKRNECNITNEEIISLISKYPKTSFEAGDHFFYSNSAYVLLAKIIEHVSSQTYANFVQENIFIPLGMNNSTLITSLKDYTEIAYGFENRGEYMPANCRMLTYGPTGVITTLNDLIKWTNNYNDNQLGFMNQNLVSRMQTKGVLNNGDSLRYGLGLFIENQCGQKMIWHGGRIPGYTSNFTLFPDKNTSIIVLSNTTDRIPYEHRFDIANILFNDSCKFINEPFPGMELGKDILKSDVPNENNAPLTDYQGIYGINDFPRKFDISVKNGQLIANSAHLTFKLKKHSPDIFISEPVVFQFIRDDKGQVSGLMLHGEKFRNLELKRNH